MTDIIKSYSATAWAWRLIIFKGFNNWFVVVAMALFAQDVSWSSMTTFQHVRLVVMALIAGAKAIEAFLNQDLGKMQSKIAADLSVSDVQSLSIPQNTQNIITIEPNQPK